MSKCIECLHYKACRDVYNDWIDKNYNPIFDEKDYARIGCINFTTHPERSHLPCKGDKVYPIYQDPTTYKYSITQREIYLIEFKDNHFYFYATPSIYFKDTEFGKSVFLTREEAEKTIEKIKEEGKKNKNDFK